MLVGKKERQIWWKFQLLFIGLGKSWFAGIERPKTSTGAWFVEKNMVWLTEMGSQERSLEREASEEEGK